MISNLNHQLSLLRQSCLSNCLCIIYTEIFSKSFKVMLFNSPPKYPNLPQVCLFLQFHISIPNAKSLGITFYSFLL